MNGKDKVFLIDSDDTLLNTSKTKEEFFNSIAEKTNLTKAKIAQIYQKTKRESGYQKLLEKFLKNIKKETKKEIKEELFYSKIKKKKLDKNFISVLKLNLSASPKRN